MSRPRRVGLFGPYASRNLGDAAIQMAVRRSLWRRRSDLEFVGLSNDPDDTWQSLDLSAFPLDGRGPARGPLAAHWPTAVTNGRTDWVSSPRALRCLDAFIGSLDLLLFSGGGQLDDFWGGAWGHPWAMLKASALARRHKIPVAVVGVGMDRLSTPLSRQFALRALGLASYVSFRDAGTQKAMHELGLRKPSRVCPDLAYALALDDFDMKVEPAGRRFAVINPVSEKTWSEVRNGRHQTYLEQLANAGTWLASRGLALRIVCSQSTMDADDAHRLSLMLQARQVEEVEVCDTSSVGSYLEQAQGAEVVIAARLHGAILGLVAGCPVVALAPLPKVGHAMQDAGLGEFSLSLQSFTTQDLTARLDQALSRVEPLRRHIKEVNMRFKDELAKTFDDVVALL